MKNVFGRKSEWNRNIILWFLGSKMPLQFVSGDGRQTVYCCWVCLNSKWETIGIFIDVLTVFGCFDRLKRSSQCDASNLFRMIPPINTHLLDCMDNSRIWKCIHIKYVWWVFSHEGWNEKKNGSSKFSKFFKCKVTKKWQDNLMVRRNVWS